MESAEMIMASGGMIFSLVMMLLPLVMLVLIWRIMRATSATSQKLDQLALQVDELARMVQGEVAALQQPAAEPDRAVPEDDTFDLLASGTTAADAADEEESFELAERQEQSATQETGEDDGFDFPAAEDEVFAGFEAAAEPPATDADAGPLADEPDETYEGLAEAGLDDSGEAFDSRLETPQEDLAAEDAFKEDFQLDAEEERLSDRLFGGSESGEDLGSAFAADETASEGYDPFAGDAEAAESDAAPAEELPEEPPEAAEPVEEQPAIIKLEDDPARPEVSMARCGTCDHKLAYKKTLAGKKARCPSCKGAFILP